MEHTHHDMPKLDPANYGPWLISLRAAAFSHGAIEHLTSKPPQPPDTTALETYLKKKHFLIGNIVSTIPGDIANLLLIPTSDPTPYELLKQSQEHLDTTNANDHKYLKQQAEEAHYLPNMTLEEYIAQHEKIRAHMIAAQYPEISDGRTTVEFMIDGLKHNPFTPPIGLQLIALNPTDIKDFIHKYKRISRYQASSHSSPTPHGTPPMPFNHIPAKRRTPRPDHQPRNIPPRYRDPEFKPCSFHLQRGVAYPQHTDNECHHPNHPKHRRIQNRPAPKARRVHFDHEPYHPDQHAESSSSNENSSDETQGMSILDTAADPTHTTHPQPSMLPLSSPINTITATKEQHPCTHTGQMTINTNKNVPITLPAVSNPAVKHNLLSVHDIASRYGNVLFTPKQAIIYNHSQGKILGTAPWKNTLRAYSWRDRTFSAKAARTIPHIRCKPNPTPRQRNKSVPPRSILTTTKHTQPLAKPLRKSIRISHQKPPRNPYQPHPDAITLAFYDWLLRLNHAPTRTIQQMAIRKTFSDLPSTLRHTPPKITCSSCAHAKQRPAPHHATAHDYPVGSYISSDTCGPITPTSRHGHNHFLTFMDAKSRYLILYFLKNRKEVGTVVPAFFALLRNRYRKQPSIYRSDNAKEFQSQAMLNTYQLHGIEYRHNTPYQPQENSIAERINQTLMNAARASLHHANLDNTFWEDAAFDAAFKYNMMLHTAHGKSPYEAWSNCIPQSKHLFTFGQHGTATIHNPKRKLQPRADPARYMYGVSANLITIYNLRSHRYQQLRPSDFRAYNHAQDPFYHHIYAIRTAKHVPNPTATPSIITNSTPDPRTHSIARRYPDADLWAAAHDKQLDNIDASDTIRWTPDEDLPPKERLIPLKMTYRYKRDPHSHTTERKARCAVRGDRMQPGIHYDPEQTTTYMAEKTSIRILLSLAGANHWPAEHFDIKAAYLHEKYQNHKPVYVQQHPRFDGSYKHPRKAGELIGNLYGTPPASHIYFTALVLHLQSIGFQQTQTDPCIFIKATEQEITLVAVSMDDFLTVANNQQLISTLCKCLQQKYNIKRLGPPSKYINWKITRQQDGSIHISQPHAIASILEKLNMAGCNPKPSPSPDKINRNIEISSPHLNLEQTQTFRMVIGDLRYLADSTRFDIFHVTNCLAAAMHQPTLYHWQLLKWLLRYLSGTPSQGILYPSHSLPNSAPQLTTYSDADYANAKDRKSYTGIVHTLHTAPICWTSSKQSVVALSTCEAEYLAASSATQQTNWLRRLLTDLHQTQTQPTHLHIDNHSAILVAKNTAPTKRRKFIDIRHHHLHDHISKKHIAVKRIPSSANPADLFSKPLGKGLFQKFTKHLNLQPIPTKAPSAPPRTV